MKTKCRKKLTLDFILRFYDAYCRTQNISKCAAAAGVTPSAMLQRIRNHPSLQQAMKLADSFRTFNNLSGYVFASLSPEAQETWEKIRQAGDKDAMNQIFSRKTKQIRQELFIFALLHSSYDVSSACRLVGIDRATIEKWRYDLEFQQLLEECQWHKKDFFERQLVGLVEERHPGAVMFVNRTLNADRGYGDKLQIDSKSDAFALEDLDLPLEVRRQILEAIRLKKARPLDASAGQLLLQAVPANPVANGEAQ